METAIFDTHAYVKRLVAAGMPEPQAEIIADEQRSLIDNKLATKQDIKALEVGLRRDIDARLAETKADILKWVAGLLLTQTAVIAALVKLL